MKESKRATTDAKRNAKDAMFEGFASIAAALASGRRVEIIEILAQGERTVEEIAAAIGQSVANTSHHLRTLARAALVSTRREGNHIYYRLASETVGDVWLAIRSLAAERLEAMQQLALAYLGDRAELEVIGVEELRDRLRTGEVVVIDVRPEPEYEAGHLPGAISVPPDDFSRLDALLEILPPDQEIVAYCRGPYCVYADHAVRYLAGKGRSAARLEEGIPEWRRGGGPVETQSIERR